VGAYKDAVRCGFKTQAEIVAAGGGDLEDVLQALADERARAAELGLTLDIDPGKVSGAGLTQARPPGSIIPQDPYATEDIAAQPESISPGETEASPEDIPEDLAEGELMSEVTS